MVEYVDPNKIEDSAAASLRKDLGEKAHLEGRIADLKTELADLTEGGDPSIRALKQLELAQSQQILERGDEAWPNAYTAFGLFLAAENYEKAAEACDVLYQCNQDQSIAALGQGIWLAVTFPMDPEITIHLLSHIVDDTPDDADGAAVAAATACFIADIRAPENQADQERLQFFSQQLLGKVARRHSNIENNDQFEFWVEKLELNDPDKFLVRLRNVIDVLVQEDWWFDRDALRDRIPH